MGEEPLEEMGAAQRVPFWESNSKQHKAPLSATKHFAVPFLCRAQKHIALASSSAPKSVPSTKQVSGTVPL